METLRDMVLPPGFGFHPKDAELISHYLKRKILGHKIEYDIIPEVDIYKHEPWDLPAKCNVPTQDNKWHFFAARDRKYPNGARSNRATIAGYWKSTGKDRTIKMDKRTIGTKKTLVFHAGRPPSGKRTEWIMHEYYIDENECQACPDMKEAFVLCKVTKRIDWTSENGNEVDNNNPHPVQPITSIIKQPDAVAAASVIGPELSQAAASVISTDLPNDVATLATTGHTTTQDGRDELDGWLNELIDHSPSFALMDPVCSDLSLDEQNAESSNLGAVALKVEPEYASPNQPDDIDYLLPDDIYNILCPGTDDFPSWNTDEASLAFAGQVYPLMPADPLTLPNNFIDATQMEELQLPLEISEPNLSNEAADTGVIVRTRHGKAPAASNSPSSYRVKLQLGINRMVTSNSESVNQTIKFVDNSSRLITNVEHQKNHVRGVNSVMQSDAGKSSRNHNQGFISGIQKALRGCSAAGLNILVALCMVGVAAAILHHGRHRAVVSL